MPQPGEILPLIVEITNLDELMLTERSSNMTIFKNSLLALALLQHDKKRLASSGLPLQPNERLQKGERLTVDYLGRRYEIILPCELISAPLTSGFKKENDVCCYEAITEGREKGAGGSIQLGEKRLYVSPDGYLSFRASSNILKTVMLHGMCEKDNKEIIEIVKKEAAILHLVNHEKGGYAHPKSNAFFAKAIRGCDLHRFTECGQLQALSFSQRLSLIRDLLEKIAYLHSLGYVHLDLKPHNVMVQNSEFGLALKVIDLGIAERTGTTLTYAVGSPGFLATAMYDKIGGQPRQVNYCYDSRGLAAIIAHIIAGKDLAVKQRGQCPQEHNKALDLSELFHESDSRGGNLSADIKATIKNVMLHLDQQEDWDAAQALSEINRLYQSEFTLAFFEQEQKIEAMLRELQHEKMHINKYWSNLVNADQKEQSINNLMILKIKYTFFEKILQSLKIIRSLDNTSARQARLESLKGDIVLIEDFLKKLEKIIMMADSAEKIGQLEELVKSVPAIIPVYVTPQYINHVLARQPVPCFFSLEGLRERADQGQIEHSSLTEEELALRAKQIADRSAFEAHQRQERVRKKERENARRVNIVTEKIPMLLRFFENFHQDLIDCQVRLQRDRVGLFRNTSATDKKIRCLNHMISVLAEMVKTFKQSMTVDHYKVAVKELNVFFQNSRFQKRLQMTCSDFALAEYSTNTDSYQLFLKNYWEFLEIIKDKPLAVGCKLSPA